MTTAAPVTQVDRTVTVQDMQVFSLGQRSEAPGPLNAVPGLGNVVATFAIPGSSANQELKVRIIGLSLTTDTPAVIDPMTGNEFTYQVNGNAVTLEAAAIAEAAPIPTGVRVTLTLEK